MRDELFDRDFQEGREAMNQGIDRLLAKLLAGFRTLAAIQFAAPWKEEVANPHRPARHS